MLGTVDYLGEMERVARTLAFDHVSNPALARWRGLLVWSSFDSRCRTLAALLADVLSCKDHRMQYFAR